MEGRAQQECSPEPIASGSSVERIVVEEEEYSEFKYPFSAKEVVQARQEEFVLPAGHTRTGIKPKKGSTVIPKYASWGVSYQNNENGQEVSSQSQNHHVMLP
jgi:hypothetical protein